MRQARLRHQREHRDVEDDAGEGLKEVRDAREQVVDAAAHVAGDAPDEYTQKHAAGDDRHRHQGREPRAVQQRAGQVDAVVGCAQGVPGARGLVLMGEVDRQGVERSQPGPDEAQHEEEQHGAEPDTGQPRARVELGLHASLTRGSMTT